MGIRVHKVVAVALRTAECAAVGAGEHVNKPGEGLVDAALN